MDNYSDLPLDKAYKLIGHGPVVWVSTSSKEEEYDLTPIAWNCPVAKSPTSLLIAVGKRHKTHSNIKDTGEFAISVPNILQVELVRQTGSVSARDTDKFNEFSIESKPGVKTKTKIPLGCLGFAECKLVHSFEVGPVSLFIGECLIAGINKKAYRDERVLIENKEAKTIHHLGSKIFAVPADEIDTL